MLSEQQQRIMGYFIEEAKDHLNTIEQGLVNLQSTITDSEMVHEVFRAAHSVKGGAAMLGLNSIQHTAHRLEDYFKVLKECPQVQVDQKLETLFLRVYDTLQDQVDHLQGPFGLTDDKAQEAMAIVEPVFAELNQHLISLVNQAGGTPPEDVEFMPAPVAEVTTAQPKIVQPAVAEESALRFIFQNDVPARLREMLQLFKQGESVATRQQLQELCRVLAQPGEQFELANWCELLQTAQRAIGNAECTNRTLAPIVIKEIKRAQELVLSGQPTEIAASEDLLNLLPEPAIEEELEPDLIDFLGEIDSDNQDLAFAASQMSDKEDFATDANPAAMFFEVEGEAEEVPDEDWFSEMSTQEDSEELGLQNGHAAELNAELNFDLEFEQISSAVNHSNDLDLSFIDRLEDEPPPSELGERNGPEVGAAELNSLADLFEGELSDLGMTWQEEEVIALPTSDLSESPLENSGDFFDLLDEDSSDELVLDEIQEDDLSGLLNAAAFQVDQPAATMLSLQATEVADISNSIADLPPDFDPPDPVASDEMAMLFFVDEQPEKAVTTSNHEKSAQPSSGFQNLDELFAGIEVEELSADSEDNSELSAGEDLSASLTSIEFNTDSAESTDSLLEDGFADLFEAEPDEVSPFASVDAEELESFSDFLLDDPASEISAALVAIEPGTISQEDAEDLPEWIDAAEDAQNPSESTMLSQHDEKSIAADAADLMDSEAAFLGFSLEDNSIEAAIADDSVSSLHEETAGFDELNLLFTEEDVSEVAEIENIVGSFDSSAVSIDESVEITAETTDLDFDAFLTEPTPEAESPDQELVASQFEAMLASEIDFEQIAEVSELTENEALDGTSADFSFDAFADELMALSEPIAEPTNEAVETPVDLNFDSISESEDEDLDWQDFNLELNAASQEEGESLDLAGDLTGTSAMNPDTNLEIVESSHEAEIDPEVDLDVDLMFSADSADFDLSLFEDTKALAEAAGADVPAEDELELDLELIDYTDQTTQDKAQDEVDLDLAPVEPTVELFDATSQEDFADLEALLPDDPLTEVQFDPAPITDSLESDDFADLEMMLAEEPLETTGIDATTNAAIETDAVDEFADLEALLGDDLNSQPLPAVIINAHTAATPPKTDDEFGDLEALLQDADQKLGVGSSPVRHATIAATRRSNRRNVIADQTMRVSVKHLDNLNNLVGEMVVNRNSLEQTQERLRQFLDNLLYQVQQLSDVGQRMRDLYERSLLESSLLASRRSYQLSGSSNSSQTSHATGVSFDALEMDKFTGFHTLSQEMIELIVRVRESASDIDFVVEESDQVTRNFRQITTQLQEGLTRSRMVPFAQTADRLPRGVRDNAIKYGKQAELFIEGRDTLIDKMIVEQLYDPMTHLVNNAIAHGIETAQERIAAGKPATGRIIVRAFHQGNQTVISVSDDGAGINTDTVKAKAVAKRLITAAEAEQMSRLDAYDLLFHHGFSTADTIDDLRGRGVGLDVVRNNLSEIRGSISIDSTIGKGSTFTIRLPLTLSISKALCCISNRARIAFPMDGVEDMLDVPKERICMDEERHPCIQWRDLLLPFQPLSDLLKYNRVLGRGSVYGGNQEDDMLSIVVLRSAGNYLALQVDQVLGEQEIVIKQLEGPVPKPVGVAGATVLGDGRIMPIADVLELIDLSQGRIRREAGNALWDTGSEQTAQDTGALKTDPTVLIVDDSITVRELLSMTFNKVGYRVEQARDGQEAWEKLRSGLPCDLVFCDIEMPRMDGLELLSRLQKEPHLCHIPIAMLTSRGADRHRQMAVQLGAKGYFTKPYLEEMLLDAAQRMLKGEVLVTSAGG